MRALVLWCPDWPVIAACREHGLDETEPVAVIAAHRVVACSTAARNAGVEPGQRRRDAAAACPRLRPVPADPAAEAAGFEPVVAALAELAPGIEVLRPGWCGLAVKGPSGWFGSEEAAGEAFVEHIAQSCDLDVRVGIADGFWPASVAALSGSIIPTGRNGEFLAGEDVGVLGLPELVDLLRRLGISSLGDFAALPVEAVAQRLGTAGLRAHARAAGRDERLPSPRVLPPDLDVADCYDQPLDRVDAAAFAARTLAERLRVKLSDHQLVCTRLAVEAVTADGAVLRRVWRHQAALRSDDVAQRVRWQLDGWLRHGAIGAITQLRLSPEDIVDGIAAQDGLWGADDGADRAGRSAVRVQGLLGTEAVYYPVSGGGRNLTDRVSLTPWGNEPGSAKTGSNPTIRNREAEPAALDHQPSSADWRMGAVGPVDRPWPGAYPAPYPTMVHPDLPRVQIDDASGRPVAVSGQGVVSGAPSRIGLGDGSRVAVVGWTGPQPLDERWWDPDRARRFARLQLLLDDGRALVVIRDEEVWRLEAGYD